jgi:hypothetical protein
MRWPLYRRPLFLGNYSRISVPGTREWLLSRTAPANRAQRKNEKQLFYLGLKRECCILGKMYFLWIFEWLLIHNLGELQITEITECKQQLYYNFCIAGYSCQFRKISSNTFSTKSQISRLQKQPQNGDSLGQSTVTHCKGMSWFEPDIGHCTMEISFESNTSLGLYGLNSHPDSQVVPPTFPIFCSHIEANTKMLPACSASTTALNCDLISSKILPNPMKASGQFFYTVYNSDIFTIDSGCLWREGLWGNTAAGTENKSFVTRHSQQLQCFFIECSLPWNSEPKVDTWSVIKTWDWPIFQYFAENKELISNNMHSMYTSTQWSSKYAILYPARHYECLQTGRSGDRIPVGSGFPHQFIPALRSNQLPVKWVPGLSRG